MATRTAAASAVLALLFVSLIAIYLLIPQNSLITFLCVLILVVSLIVAQSRRWRDIGIMAIFAAIVSMVAASLFGRQLFGNLGAIVVPLLWVAALFAFFSWTRSRMIMVPKDRAILIANGYSGTIRIAEGPIAPPLTPAVESIYARIPLYELAEDAQIEKVNTKGPNVDRIDVQIHYRVVDPRSALTGMPNRSLAQSTIAKEMGVRLEEARCDVTFWEKLLSKQVRLEVDDIVRKVVYDNPFAQNPIEVYAKREDLADIVCKQLTDACSRWGVEITDLVFEGVEVSGDVRKSINKAKVREEETKYKREDAEIEAYRVKALTDAQSDAEARRVFQIVRALQASNIKLSAEELRDIVVDAIHASTEMAMENTYSRPLLEAPAAPKPVDKKDNAPKK